MLFLSNDDISSFPFSSSSSSSSVRSNPLLPVKHDDLVACALKMIKFIEKYTWIYNYHAADLFSLNIFEERCPQHWQHLIQEKISDTAFIKLWVQLASKEPDTLANIKTTWPQDLVEFIQEAHSMSLSNYFPSIPLKTPEKLDPALTIGMNSKKLHEVPFLASFLSDWCSQFNVHHLVDLGAGQGYLSSTLALRHGFHVIGVDNDPIQIQGAQKRMKQLKKTYSSQQQGSLQFFQKHVTAHDTFLSLLKEANSLNSSNELSSSPPSSTVYQTDVPWGFIGLHTCGDLSPTTLRLWQASQAQLLVNVGCCYNLLTEPKVCDGAEKRHFDLKSTSEETDPSLNAVYGFPMSQALSKIRLGWTARLLACQSTARWIYEFENAHDSFVRHFYRALLQTYLVDYPPQQPIKTFKTRKGKLPSFETYATSAFSQFKLPVPLDLTQRYAEYMAQGGLRKVTMMWTLRAHMAEAIESLILLDRCVWVHEQDARHQVFLFPLFHPVLSPRNFAIACTKVSKSGAFDRATSKDEKKKVNSE